MLLLLHIVFTVRIYFWEYLCLVSWGLLRYTTKLERLLAQKHSPFLWVHLFDSSVPCSSSPEARTDAPDFHGKNFERGHAPEKRVGRALRAVLATGFFQELVQASSEVAIDRRCTVQRAVAAVHADEEYSDAREKQLHAP